MDGLWKTIQEKMPEIVDRVKSIKDDVEIWTSSIVSKADSTPESVIIGHRHLDLIEKLAEGGYSFVYLARQRPSPSSSSSGTITSSYNSNNLQQQQQPVFALKKVLIGTPEQLAEVNKEIQVLQILKKHPSLLPLLDSSIQQQQSTQMKVAWMLFPLYDINLWDFIQKLRQRGGWLAVNDIKALFSQICHALYAMHAANYTHRDIKPHNVLLKQSKEGADSNSTDKKYHAALTDFGSAGPARVTISTRQQALSIQEDAERHTTAPYRAPELWDTPSDCIIDDTIDSWAAGCVLYYMMVGESPFERSSNQAGGSLMICIMQGKYDWPEEVVERYPEGECGLMGMVERCLKVVPGARARVGDLLGALPQ